MTNKYLEKIAEWEKEAGLKEVAKGVVKKYKTGKMTRLATKRYDAGKYHGDLKSMNTAWGSDKKMGKKFRKSLAKGDKTSGKAFEKAKKKHKAYEAKNPNIKSRRASSDGIDAIHLTHKDPTTGIGDYSRFVPKNMKKK